MLQRRKDDFNEIKSFVKDMCFYSREDFERLRCLWTTYAIRYHLMADTADYDCELRCLFDFIRSTMKEAKDQKLNIEKLKRFYFCSFDDFMVKYLV